MGIDRQLGKARAAQADFEALVLRQVFNSLDQAQTFLDRCLHSRWFAHRWPKLAHSGITIKPIYLNSNFHGGWDFEKVAAERNAYRLQLFPMIYLPEFKADLFGTGRVEWTDIMVLHLLAHWCSGDENHGRGWALAFLQLVRRHLGGQAAWQLQQAYRKHQVRYRPKQKLTAAQREARRQRMLALHNSRRAFPPSKTAE
jgi:hypothetical protein